MTNKGVTLIELIIVIVIIGIISAFAVPAVMRYLEDAQVAADEQNIEVLEDMIIAAFADGTLILRNNQVYNTKSERGYSGTGLWFRDDMVDYLSMRVFPMVEEAQNQHNWDTGFKDYKFLFRVEDKTVHVIYYDRDRTEVIMTSIDTTDLEAR